MESAGLELGRTLLLRTHRLAWPAFNRLIYQDRRSDVYCYLLKPDVNIDRTRVQWRLHFRSADDTNSISFLTHSSFLPKSTRPKKVSGHLLDNLEILEKHQSCRPVIFSIGTYNEALSSKSEEILNTVVRILNKEFIIGKLVFRFSHLIKLRLF